MRMFRYATVENISGIIQQMRQHDFDRPIRRATNPGKRKSDAPAEPTARGGFFWTGLTPELRASLIRFVRRMAKRARADGRLALEAQAAEKMARREERVITMLNQHVEAYAEAKELFTEWQGPGRATSVVAVQQALHETVNGKKRPKSEAAQLEYLRRQISMRVLGLGWTQYATRWSSNKDARIGTVAHLTELLEELIREEISRQRFTPGTEKGLPDEAAPPQHGVRNVGQLGTLDADAIDISARALFSAEELQVKVEKEMRRRVEAGISCPVEALQPDHAPAFDQALVGKRIEVLWKYFDKDSKQPHLIWATGTVKRIADGLTDKRSSRASKILPGGAVLWAWDADPDFDEAAGEQWLILLPKKFNPRTHKQVYSWRFDPRQLGAAGRRADDDEQRKRMRRGAYDGA